MALMFYKLLRSVKARNYPIPQFPPSRAFHLSSWIYIYIVCGSSLKTSVDAVIRLRPSSRDLGTIAGHVGRPCHAFRSAFQESTKDHQGQHMQPYWSRGGSVTFIRYHNIRITWFKLCGGRREQQSLSCYSDQSCQLDRLVTSRIQSIGSS